MRPLPSLSSFCHYQPFPSNTLYAMSMRYEMLRSGYAYMLLSEPRYIFTPWRERYACRELRLLRPRDERGARGARPCERWGGCAVLRRRRDECDASAHRDSWLAPAREHTCSHGHTHDTAMLAIIAARRCATPRDFIIIVFAPLQTPRLRQYGFSRYFTRCATMIYDIWYLPLFRHEPTITILCH